MSSLIKICGLSTPKAVAVARDGGATYLGFIFFEKSPRNVTPQLAGELVKQAKTCKTVAVTVNADDAFLDQIVAQMAPDLLQLHGSETPERVKNVKNRYGLPVIKAFSVREQSDLSKVRDYESVADLLLLDAKAPKDSVLPGGNGISFDWRLIENLQSKIPVLLAGGIDLANAKQAIKCVNAATNALIGLDVSSGVESAPGVKDNLKIEAFLSACHAAGK